MVVQCSGFDSFQFLIGAMKECLNISHPASISEFQFLIGAMKVKKEVCFIDVVAVSIPYRRNERMTVMLPPGRGKRSFNSL